MQVKQLDTDMFAWPENTRHYRLKDGTYLAVEATMPGDNVVPVGAMPMIDEVVAIVGQGRKIKTFVQRPTVVFAVTEDARPLNDDLTPIAKFDPGTSHEDALKQMGHKVA